MLQYSSIFGKLHNESYSFGASFQVPRSIAPFKLDYVFTDPQLSQEINLVIYHRHLLSRWISMIYHICLYCITYYFRLIVLLSSFLCNFFSIKQCILICFIRVNKVDEIWLILSRWWPRYVKIHSGLRPATNPFFIAKFFFYYRIFY